MDDDFNLAFLNIPLYRFALFVGVDDGDWNDWNFLLGGDGKRAFFKLCHGSVF